MHANDAPAAWLLARGINGLELTKMGALQRAIAREAAERWPHWWRHDLFGPPNREADLPVLEEMHASLRRLRLLRKHRETLRTTARCSRIPTRCSSRSATGSVATSRFTRMPGRSSRQWCATTARSTASAWPS